jgi:hypothetical protein
MDQTVTLLKASKTLSLKEQKTGTFNSSKLIKQKSIVFGLRYDHIMDSADDDDKKSDDQDIQLNYYIKILSLLQSDLLKAIEYHEKIYAE